MSNADLTVVAARSDGDLSRFLERVKQALADFTEVTVVTAVGDLPVTIKTTGKTTETTFAETTLPGNAIVTIVKVLDGDVTTVIPEGLVDKTDLRALHTAQVETSLKVLPDHIRTLVEAVKSLLG